MALNSKGYSLLTLLLAIVVLISLAMGIIAMSVTPQQQTTANHESPVLLLAAIVTALLAATAWVVRLANDTVRRRAKLAVLELLSDHQPRTLIDIGRQVEWWRRHAGLHVDALSDLVTEQKVVVDNGMYCCPEEQRIYLG